MKIIFYKPFILLIVTLFSSLAFASISAQSFYNIDTVQTIRITFAESNWDFRLDTAKAGSESYIMAQSITINGTKYDSVGVKYKGNSTYNANQVKNPFHIELDTYKEQDYQGITDIKMSNVAKDPSFVREVLSYTMLRDYMEAPQSNYVNVYVNDKLIGLYVSSESVGKKFISKYFFSKDKAFFKCNPIDGAGPTTTTLPNLTYQGKDSTALAYTKAYEMKSDIGWGELIAMIDTLNNNFSAIEKVLDIDRTLWMLAFNNVTVNLDSYIGTFQQNYYLYKDGTGRFNPIIWDLNEGFGTFSQTGTIALNSTTAKAQMTPYLHENDTKWPLVNKLLAVPLYKRMYLAHFRTILDDYITNGRYLTLARQYQTIASASVTADPNKFFTVAQFQSNITTDITSGGGGPMGGRGAPGLSSLMAARGTYLNGLSVFNGTKPVISSILTSATSPNVGDKITIKATLINATTALLGYRESAEAKFVRVPMYDDGKHGDGASGDNVWGAEITLKTVNTQYYIYSENATIGTFSPARAEHEYYSIAANASVNNNTVVMNEIYARGTAVEPDWIELYNKTSAAIDISGYKIYDSGGNAGTKPKKVFPNGSVIAANGYLVITVDVSDDSGFGLSNSGEKVWFENTSGVVIDSINYEAHTATQSYGRIPNGGNWQLLNTITKNGSNSTTTGTSELEDALGINLKIYPNPASYMITVSLETSVSNDVQIVIIGLNGAIEKTIQLNAGEKEVQIGVSDIAKGMHFMRLTFEGKSILKRFISM